MVDPEPPPTPTASRPVFMRRTPLEHLNEDLVGIITAVRLLDDNLVEEQLTGEQLKNEFAQLFPPGNLFAPSIQTLPNVYVEIKKWLNKNGANITDHGSRRVVKSLANGLYENSEDTVVANNMANAIVTAGRRSTVTEQATSSSPPRNRNTRESGSHSSNVVYSVSKAYYREGSKFSGEIGQSWNEAVANYQQVAKDYELTDRQKLQYIHYMLDGDAKRYYYDSVEPQAGTFNHAIMLIGNEYNSMVRQNRVKNVLSTLRLQQHIGEDGDEGKALANIYRIITKLAPQVPQSHRGNAHKVASSEMPSLVLAGLRNHLAVLRRVA